MKVYYIDENLRKNNTAGSKAPDDIASICAECGYIAIRMPMLKYRTNRFIKNIEMILKYLCFFAFLYFKIPNEAVIIYQHPTLGKKMVTKLFPFLIRRKQFKVVAFIHDLESLRGGIKDQFSIDTKTFVSSEIQLLTMCSVVISHNSKMSSYLESQGIDRRNIVDLGIFDYLGLNNVPIKADEDKFRVCIAGNLTKGKSGYVYEISKTNTKLKVNLYGNNYTGEGDPTLNYVGSFKPEELPQYIKGRFGIVWDGNTCSTCAGNTGEYLKYNNPHKTSLYLGVGLPVVVWNKAAISDFITENQVGITVESLEHLDFVLSNIDDTTYDSLKLNAEKTGLKIREGYYTRRALQNALNVIEKDSQSGK